MSIISQLLTDHWARQVFEAIVLVSILWLVPRGFRRFYEESRDFLDFLRPRARKLLNFLRRHNVLRLDRRQGSPRLPPGQPERRALARPCDGTA